MLVSYLLIGPVKVQKDTITRSYGCNALGAKGSEDVRSLSVPSAHTHRLRGGSEAKGDKGEVLKMSERRIFWFEEIGQEHNELMGKKCANLGEMLRLGLPVPPGFAISLDTYRSFLDQTGAGREIADYVESLGELKGRGIDIFEEASRVIRCIIEEKVMPKTIEEEILSYYSQLCERVGMADAAVSVRSAGTQSRPGMFETYLNVRGPGNVIENVKKVWASAYTGRAIAFRANKGFPIIGDELGVAIPKMVNARCAGIGFTVDPVTGDASKVVIEANWGLGEGVVSGSESVDKFVVDKASMQIMEREVAEKMKRVAFKEAGADWEEIPEEIRHIPCLSDEEIIGVAELAKTLEEKLGQPQDMEWSIDADFPAGRNLFLLQTRPAKVVASGTANEQLADKLLGVFKEVDTSWVKDKLKHVEFKF